MSKENSIDLKNVLIFISMNTILFTTPVDMINIICMRYIQIAYGIVERIFPVMKHFIWLHALPFVYSSIPYFNNEYSEIPFGLFNRSLHAQHTFIRDLIERNEF
jgi:hypothetical protein